MTTPLTIEEYDLMIFEIGTRALGALTASNTLGHVSIAFTARHYIHGDDPRVRFVAALMTGDAAEATAALDRLIAAMPGIAAEDGYQREGHELTSIESARSLAASQMSQLLPDLAGAR